MLTQEQTQKIPKYKLEREKQIRAIKHFRWFVKDIFSLSGDILKNGEWTHGEFIDGICDWMQENPRTIRVSAKDHFKSMSFYAHIMWKLYRSFYMPESREIQYFSYREAMSAYHLSKIKEAIACNPYFELVMDLKPRAEGVISYTWDGRHKITVTPRGILEFNRGIHCDDVYADDILQDPENKMVPTKIYKVNSLMKLKILDMPQQELHVVGTAQTSHDFFFDKEFTSRFGVKILPAVVDDKTHKVLWPEWMTYEELMAKKKERGENAFNQEYLVQPVYSANAFLAKERLMKCVNPDLKNYTPKEWRDNIKSREKRGKRVDWDVLGGWDLGKKNHPAHFVLFEKRDKKKIQIHTKWFDRVNYQDQLEHIQECIEAFEITNINFDSTRGELEMMEESGELPPELEGVHFTSKAKNSMATALDKEVTNETIEFISDQRQIDQMLIVNSDLQAPTTPQGHGDSFWSVCLALTGDAENSVDIDFM